jgi:hypothetical protein
LGADPEKLYKFLKGVMDITVADYIKFMRALGYRSKVTLEKSKMTLQGCSQ